jgi:hypothetical protein
MIGAIYPGQMYPGGVSTLSLRQFAVMVGPLGSHADMYDGKGGVVPTVTDHPLYDEQPGGQAVAHETYGGES